MFMFSVAQPSSPCQSAEIFQGDERLAAAFVVTMFLLTVGY
jgi:hypothetical protein